MQFAQQLINGLVIGTIYSLIALGYTMVFGILGFINFAHGEVYMMGAFLGLVLLSTGIFNFWTAMAGTMILTAIMGVFIDQAIYRPVRRFGKGFDDALLVSAIGVSIFLQTLVQVFWGTETHPMGVAVGKSVYSVGGLSISGLQVLIFVLSAALMFLLHLFATKTVTGTAMRATSQDLAAARLMGISVNRVIATTFAIGSILAAAGGMLVGAYFDAVYPLMGYTAGIKAFTAAVLGGIGSIPGAMLGGVLIGVTETLGAAYISSAFRDGFAFVILILTLLLLPSGLFRVKGGEGKV
ncbi:MAG TPA: branched-chain amino acid ABC transporter permease [Firmicutes bacterium]|nr:branched-chain amino acid ABC transporter permease [Bacillota bacterium]